MRGVPARITFSKILLYAKFLNAPKNGIFRRSDCSDRADGFPLFGVLTLSRQLLPAGRKKCVMLLVRQAKYIGGVYVEHGAQVGECIQRGHFFAPNIA